MVTKNLQSVVLTFIWNEKAYCLGRVAPPCSPCEIPSCCVRTIVRGHIRRQHGIDGHCCTGMNLILIELLLTNSVCVIFLVHGDKLSHQQQECGFNIVKRHYKIKFCRDHKGPFADINFRLFGNMLLWSMHSLSGSCSNWFTWWLSFAIRERVKSWS